MQIRTQATAQCATIFGAIMTLLVACPTWAEEATNTAAVTERTAPVGHVCIEGQPCATAVAAAATGGAPRSGEDVYEKTCKNCHNTGTLGAPKIGDAKDWTARLEKSGGKDGLYQNAIKGIRNMPPKGTCAACTDDELKSAVDYMLSK